MWDFLPLHTRPNEAANLDPDAYGLTLTPHDGFRCAAQSAALPETLRRKIILKLNYIYPTQKFYFTLLFFFESRGSALYRVGFLAKQTEMSGIISTLE